MKRIFTLFIITSLCICKANNSTAQVNVNDSLALVDLYNSTDGAHWTNHSGWLQGPVSAWYGINIGGGRIISIDLSENNLYGQIPSSLGNLTSLMELFLNYNQLYGQMPSSLGNLTQLFDFALNSNNLTDTIPSSLGNLTKVVEFSLSNNKLTGSIPASFGNNFMINLDIFSLNNNQLTGSIPASLSHLGTSVTINLEANLLSGTIPVDFLNLGQFDGLILPNNHFTFDGIENIVAAHPSFYFTYAPQLNIPITYTPQGAYGKLSVHAGGTLSNNTYLWYRNNSLYKTIVGDSAFVVDAPGVYFVKVNNTVVTALQLTSDSITIAAACSAPPANAATTNIKQTTARLNWNAAQGAVKYQIKFGATGGAVSTINTATPYYKLSGLTPNTNYTWKVRSKCSLQYSAYSAEKSFTTLPAFAATSQEEDEIKKENSFTISPNPASANVNVLFNSTKQSAYSITVYDIEGKMLLSKTGSANAGINNFMLDVHALSAGTYFIKIQCGANKTIVQKLVKE